ncbi:MAG: sulfotransferase [Actinomycetota bacterium]|nr:sulfotransferase [Actinomycetota bacterium]
MRVGSHRQLRSHDPILVTGSHRSGTTWVGRMLCASGEAAYIHEPFCPNRSPGWITEPLPYWYMYISPENESPYLPGVRRVLQLRYPVARSLVASRSARDVARQLPEIPRGLSYRVRGLRPLLKDPFALFSSEWLADRFRVRPVIMIRKPVAFVSSIKRLNWGFDYEQNWLAQPALMRDHLGGHEGSFRGYQGEVDLVKEGIVMWNAIYDFVRALEARRPEFLYVKYEELAAEPVAGFEKLYAGLGLTWDEDARARVADFSDSTNPKDVSTRDRRAIKRDSRAAAETWRQRLSPEEIERVERETAAVAAHFYDD